MLLEISGEITPERMKRCLCVALGTRSLAEHLLCAELGETPEDHAGHLLSCPQACGQKQRGSQEPG